MCFQSSDGVSCWYICDRFSQYCSVAAHVINARRQHVASSVKSAYCYVHYTCYAGTLLSIFGFNCHSQTMNLQQCYSKMEKLYVIYCAFFQSVHKLRTYWHDSDRLPILKPLHFAQCSKSYSLLDGPITEHCLAYFFLRSLLEEIFSLLVLVGCYETVSHFLYYCLFTSK